MSESLRVLRPADYKPMPWANGGGVTTELAVETSPEGGFAWRVSIATVDRAGPFSRFPGCDRIITLLEGDGMALSFGGAAPPATLATPLEPFPFSGDWATDCRLLGGTVSDFNLILDRRAVRATVTPLPLGPAPQRHAVAGEVVLAYVVRGDATAQLSKDDARSLAPGETLLWRREAGPGAIGLGGTGAVLGAVLVADIVRVDP